MSEALQIAITSAAGTLVISWGSLYLSHRLDLARQIRLRQIDARVQAYASIVGQRLVVAQLYVSRFEAYVFSDYHEARWRLAGHPNDALDLQEAQRWMRKSEDLALDVARANRELFEAVAAARAVFPKTRSLQELADGVYRHSVPVISVRPHAIMTAAELETWKVTAVQQVQELVTRTIERPIDALIEHLSHHVRSEA